MHYCYHISMNWFIYFSISSKFLTFNNNTSLTQFIGDGCTSGIPFNCITGKALILTRISGSVETTDDNVSIFQGHICPCSCNIAAIECDSQCSLWVCFMLTSQRNVHSFPYTALQCTRGIVSSFTKLWCS